MPLSIACMLFHTYQSGDGLVFLVIFGGGVCYLGGIALWRYSARRAKEGRARKWPAVSAVIDIAVVDKEWVPDGRGNRGFYEYLVMLTYAYHNPDLQTGDFTRRFDNEVDANDWADACRGRTVTVHLDPRDPANSVLRTEDLDTAVPEPF